VNSIADINPALIILGCLGVYVILSFIRHNFGWIVLGAWILLCLSLVALPAGKAVFKQAEALPSALPRMQCVVAAVGALAPWKDSSAVLTVPSCHFQGVGISGLGASPAAQTEAAAVNPTLLQTYGR
jgi:hypothetical protein